MPIYEYMCHQCQHLQQMLVRRGDEQKPACKRCGSTELKRQVSTSAFHLKGGGWYSSGYESSSSDGSNQSKE